MNNKTSSIEMNRFLKLTYTILIGLGIFSLIRIGLLITYFDIFKDGGFLGILVSIFHGIRFDASIFLTIISVFIVLLILPINNMLYHKIVMWLLYPIYVGIAIFLIGDLIYFKEVGRHVTNELMLMGNEGGFAIQMLKEYILHITFALIAAVIGGYFWNKFTNIKIKPVNFNINGLTKYAVSFILTAGIVFLLIRGSVEHKPISTINAFISGNNNLGVLTLNGLFTSLRYMTKKQGISKKDYTFMTDNESYSIMQSLRNNDCKLDLGLPKNPNIIFIQLESWSAYYVDFFSKKNMGLTPNLDRIAKEGYAFMHHFTPEKRSITSIQASLLGIPPMTGLPNLGFGLEVIAGSGNIGNKLKSVGYDTVFIQSSKRNSYYLDQIAKSLGFEEFYGMEDVTQILDYPNWKAPAFGWDYETYMKLYESLENKGKDKPFFAYIFTGTTHSPFAEPPKELVKFPHETNGENGLKNTLFYADWSLNEFIKKLSTKDFYNNTVFIITADHTTGLPNDAVFPESYRIPFVIWSPTMKNGKTFSYTTSHIDIPPTLLELANVDYDKNQYAGENIFCKKPENAFAVINLHTSSAIVNNDKYLNHSFKNIIDYSPKDMNEADTKKLEKIILAYYQEMFNRIYTSNKKENTEKK